MRKIKIPDKSPVLPFIDPSFDVLNLEEIKRLANNLLTEDVKTITAFERWLKQWYALFAMMHDGFYRLDIALSKNTSNLAIQDKLDESNHLNEGFASFYANFFVCEVAPIWLLL